MEAQTACRTTLHPLVATAAVAVTLASAVGITVMTGVLPSGTARQAEPSFVAQAAPPVAAAPQPVVAGPAVVPPVVAPVAVSVPVVEPAPVVKPVVKAAPKPKPVVHKPAPVPEEPVQVVQAAVPPPASFPAIPLDYRPPVEARAPAPTAAPAPASVLLAATKPLCLECGVVESMREVEKKGEGTGLGAVAGGMGGLLLGHQVGNGTGNKIATVLGAVGGAFAGNQIEKNARTIKSYEIGVRMEGGSYRSIASTNPPTWRAGDHVRIVNGVIQSDVR